MRYSFLIILLILFCSCSKEEPSPVEEPRPIIIYDNRPLHGLINGQEWNFSAGAAKKIPASTPSKAKFSCDLHKNSIDDTLDYVVFEYEINSNLYNPKEFQLGIDPAVFKIYQEFVDGDFGFNSNFEGAFEILTYDSSSISGRIHIYDVSYPNTTFLSGHFTIPVN